MSDLIYPKESYDLVGSAFAVYNDLRYGHADDFYPLHIKQVLTYLRATGKKLGIIILITPDGIKYKRLVN